MVDSETPFRATMWCAKLMVLISSSGRSGEPPNEPAGISDPSYAGWFCVIASCVSIATKVGVPPSLVDVAIVSDVILLLTVPAARLAPAFWLLIGSPDSLGGYFMI